MIKALIFDLDSCLAAANEPGESIFAEAFQAIRSQNKGEVSEGQLRAAFQECWRFPFDFVADKYGFSPAMRAAGFTAFCRVEVREPMHGYGDLDELAQLPAKLFLVTSGFRRLQESKIRALGIAHLFTGIHIDAIEEAGPKGKLAAFQAILLEHHLLPQEVLVVGDNPDSEIAAGTRLGIRTIQVLRPGVPASSAATYQIQNLRELGPLMRKLNE
jgi:putative hydrolase of the HAD superfamily